MKGAQPAWDETSVREKLETCQMLNLISKCLFSLFLVSPPAPDKRPDPIERSFETGRHPADMSEDTKQKYPDPQSIQEARIVGLYSMQRKVKPSFHLLPSNC